MDNIYSSQKIHKSGESPKKITSGFIQIYTRYTAQNCKGCPLRSVCVKEKIIVVGKKRNH